jgi:hypothetical protein
MESGGEKFENSVFSRRNKTTTPAAARTTKKL